MPNGPRLIDDIFSFGGNVASSLRPIVQRNSVFPANLIASSINGLTRYRIYIYTHAYEERTNTNTERERTRYNAFG